MPSGARQGRAEKAQNCNFDFSVVSVLGLLMFNFVISIFENPSQHSLVLLLPSALDLDLPQLHHKVEAN